ncbi:uncharacterized protein N7443_008225, partial [Penicillium atrosanguineum]|uniref:uncharacterized protein n=1 Tax=Penicillium atrosanguineum TaxID=1132637 RepID=UPI0023884907
RPEGSHSARDLIISCAASGLPASLSKDVHFVATGSSWFCGWYPSSGTDQLCLERGCPCWLEEPLHLRSPDCRIPPSGVLVQSSSAVHCIHYYIALFPPEISPGYLDASLLDGPSMEVIKGDSPLLTTAIWSAAAVSGAVAALIPDSCLVVCPPASPLCHDVFHGWSIGICHRASRFRPTRLKLSSSA